MPEHPCLILNPKAGSDLRRRTANRLEKFLRMAYPTLVVMRTQRPGDGIRLAREAVLSGSDLIYAAGGDGTYNEVLNGAAGSQARLAFLPMGTGNSLVRELGLPVHPIKAARVLVSGKARPVHLGRIQPAGISDGPDGSGRRYFILMAGAGFDAYVVQRVGVRLKRFLGKMAFVLCGVWCLWSYRYPVITFRVNGKRLAGTTGIVSKGQSYAGPFTIAPGADLAKPSFELCLFKGRGFFTYLKYGLAVMLGIHHRLRDVEMHTVERLRIESDEPVPVHVDGEPIGSLPVEVSLGERAVPVIYPSNEQ